MTDRLTDHTHKTRSEALPICPTLSPTHFSLVRGPTGGVCLSHRHSPTALGLPYALRSTCAAILLLYIYYRYRYRYRGRFGFPAPGSFHLLRLRIVHVHLHAHSNAPRPRLSVVPHACSCSRLPQKKTIADTPIDSPVRSLNLRSAFSRP